MYEVDDERELVRVQQELEAMVQRRLLEGLTRHEEEHYTALLAVESRLLAQRRPDESSRR